MPSKQLLLKVKLCTTEGFLAANGRSTATLLRMPAPINLWISFLAATIEPTENHMVLLS